MNAAQHIHSFGVSTSSCWMIKINSDFGIKSLNCDGSTGSWPKGPPGSDNCSPPVPLTHRIHLLFTLLTRCRSLIVDLNKPIVAHYLQSTMMELQNKAPRFVWEMPTYVQRSARAEIVGPDPTRSLQIATRDPLDNTLATIETTYRVVYSAWFYFSKSFIATKRE